MTSAAAALLHAGTSSMQVVGLADLPPPDETLVRTDRKYFVPLASLEHLLAVVASQHAVLEVGGRRLFDYRSVYFDDAGLGCYRAHLQRRRLRWKVRTRTYLDSGDSMLEVKLRSARGQTVKERARHDGAPSDTLDPRSWSFVSSVVGNRYGARVPDTLQMTVVTDYSRATFVRLDDSSRMTADLGVRCGTAARGAMTRGDHVLVETKSPHGSGPADRALRALGVRPVSMSKYCVGVAAARPDLPSNPWRPVLRRYFTADEAGAPSDGPTS